MVVIKIRQQGNGARWLRATAGAVLVLGSAFTQAGEAERFTGTWSVTWCDKTQPGKDCGGFTAHLLQQGSRLCGTHSGATPNLSRLDEGGGLSIVGVVMDEIAVLTIRSGRNDSIHMVTARQQGDVVDWQLTDTVLKSDTDTEVIPASAKLSQATAASHVQGFKAAHQACLKHWQPAR